MMYTAKAIILCFLLLATLNSRAQSLISLGGEWTGRLKDASGEFDYTLKLKREDSGAYTGVSTSRNANFYSQTKVKAVDRDGRLIVSELEVLDTDYPYKQALCLLNLVLAVGGYSLSGHFSPSNSAKDCLSGIVSLSRVSTELGNRKVLGAQRAVKVFPQVDNAKSSSPGLSQATQVALANLDSAATRLPLSRVENRLRTIEIDDDEAELVILDNMAVDGDIITLINNDNVVFRRVTLTKKPISYKISNKKSSTHLLKFHAENLGDTPPNTGVLIVKTRKSVVRTDFTSDFSQTATIQINLRQAL
jgi:hypothetical protein